MAEAPRTRRINGKTDVLGVGVDEITVEGLHERIQSFATGDARATILNVNAHCLNLASRDGDLRRFLNAADVVFCDGAGVMLAARMLGEKMPARITYADWLPVLADFAANEGFSMYFLGGKPGVAEKAANRLRSSRPNLDIAGTRHGYFQRFGSDPVVREINAASPDVLIVGMGMPRQEEWLMDHREKLNARVVLTGGAAFDYASGELRRGPRLLTDNGFEWLARLAVEPGRLWKRYLVGNPAFALRVLRQVLWERILARGR